MTKVVNVKKERCDVYIGRPSIYGNPFRIGDHGDRRQVLNKYKSWFEGKMLTDSAFRDRMLSLKDKVLGCWCKPLSCHGDVIAEYLDKNETKD